MEKLEKAVKENGKEKIPYVLITITCNSGGGQPVSMENIKAVSGLCRSHGLRLFPDAAGCGKRALHKGKRK